MMPAAVTTFTAASEESQAGTTTTMSGSISHAVWPDHAPHADEVHIVTVIVSESQYRWAVHEGFNDDFFPILFWR